MARKNLYTLEQLKQMAEEIDAKKLVTSSYTAKDYAEEKQIVYGTLYQALRRAGLFKPSRIRTRKVADVSKDSSPTIVAA
jgi:transposase